MSGARALTVAFALLLGACADEPAPEPAAATAPAPAAAPALPPSPAMAPPAASDQQGEVRAAFARYRTAASAGDGVGAVAMVDATTVAYYDEALRRARTATRGDLGRLSLVDRLVVLSIRHRVPADSPARRDGRSLVAAGVADGWIGRQGTAHMELGEVSVNGDVADAPVLVDGQPSEFAFRFRREPAGWRLDLTSVHPATERALEAAIAQSGLPADAFMEAALQQATGRVVGPDVWSPEGG